MMQRPDLPCDICKKTIPDNEYVVNWGMCNDCWDDIIDADHIMRLFKKEWSVPPASPSPKIERIMIILERWLKQDEKT